MKLKTIKPTKFDMPVQSEKTYPSLFLSSRELPEIKNWKVGKTYRIVLEVKQTSSEVREDKNGEKVHATFDIRKIGTPKSLQKNKELREKIRDL